jgi:hypothetical protein
MINPNPPYNKFQTSYGPPLLLLFHLQQSPKHHYKDFNNSTPNKVKHTHTHEALENRYMATAAACKRNKIRKKSNHHQQQQQPIILSN